MARARASADSPERFYRLLVDYQRRLEALERKASLEPSWNEWKPVLSQSVTVNYTRDAVTNFLVLGEVCFFQFGLAITSAGTGGNQVHLTWPVEPASQSFYQRFGTWHLYDASANTRYIGCLETVSTSGGVFVFPWTGTSGTLGTSPAVTLASSDQFNGSGFYRIAA